MATNSLVVLVDEEIKKRNLSLRDFAKLAGVSHPMIGRILDGEKPSFETCEKLAPVLHLPTVTVLQAAGLLPQITIEQSTLDELKNVLSQLPPEKWAEFLEHGWVMVRNARREPVKVENK